MKNLTLSIKQEYFDQILAGAKKEETREIRPSNQHKYCKVDGEGFVIEDDNGIVPVEYDTLTLLTGQYKGKRPRLVVKVKSAKIELIYDEETDEFITLQDEKGEEYIAARIVYQLGEIIEKPN